MSGRKYSRVTYDAQREIRRAMLAELRGAAQTLKEQRQAVAGLLRNMDPVVRDEVGRLTDSASNWLDATAGHSTKGLTLASETGTVQEALSAHRTALERGAPVAAQLSEALASASARVRARLDDRMASASATRAVYAPLFPKWGVELGLAETLDSVRADIAEGRLSHAAINLDSVEASLAVARLRVDEGERRERTDRATGVYAEELRNLSMAASRLREAVSAIPTPLRGAYSTSISQVESLLAEISSLPNPDGRSEVELERATASARSSLEAATALERTVIQTVYREVSALRSRCEEAQRGVEAALEASDESLRRWGLEEEGDQARALTAAADSQASLGDYPQALQNVANARAVIDAACARSVDFEEAHERRLYVIQGLWKVLSDMGYRAEDPALERPEDLRSRIVLRVDTLTRGEVTFFVSLEDIESDSCISERFCLSDFDAVSARLREEFGVTTRFRTEEPSGGPKFVAKGERDEPTGANRSAST